MTNKQDILHDPWDEDDVTDLHDNLSSLQIIVLFTYLTNTTFS